MDFSSATSLVQVSADGHVALVEINRPQKRNALSQDTIDCLVGAIAKVEKDENIKVVILTGSRRTGPFSGMSFPDLLGRHEVVVTACHELCTSVVVCDRSFAVVEQVRREAELRLLGGTVPELEMVEAQAERAVNFPGADLSELRHLSTAEAHRIQYLKDLADAVTSMRKPIIAAVAGFACDIIYAADDAQFGLPELSVGTIPGAGGTQRLTRLAMDMILNSLTITGEELRHYGLVAQTFPTDALLPATMAAAQKIASRSTPVVQLAKQAILNAEQTHLDAGLALERSLYYGSFSLDDRTEGMAAFVEKRQPVFKDR
ncbi:hypothetical protein BP5796_03131 [Coleophoma crateriformis]|uniref:Enoyl-CoA hydratase n=1 Tax=Coleophoma crateriformis TaxID=565419 RepID=A0A3D8SM91_9HELO|nr:hypothetical protein BP5796_03131 [Coleophoma crateriformis]